MTNQEAREIRKHLLEIAESRSEENIIPDFANELIRRLVEKRDDGEQLSVVDQVQSALGLLKVTAFRPSRVDAKGVLAELSEMCGETQFLDAVYTDLETGRSVSLLNALPEIAPDALELRQFLDQRLQVVESEFENWQPPSPREDDGNTPGGPT